MDTLQEILLGCDQVELLLKDAAPVADPARLQRIQFLCAKMTGMDVYITEKASRLSVRAAIYLSARRHEKESQGASGVMQQMRYSLLEAIRERASYLIRTSA